MKVVMKDTGEERIVTPGQMMIGEAITEITSLTIKDIRHPLFLVWFTDSVLTRFECKE